jgi:putative transposase
MIAALIRTVFAHPDGTTARTQRRGVVDQLGPDAPTVAERLQGMENDVLAYTGFPAAH